MDKDTEALREKRTGLPGVIDLMSRGKRFRPQSCLFFGFRDRVSLYSSGCPETHSVDQAGLELRNLPASASRVLGLKACATMPGNPVRFYATTQALVFAA